MTDRPSPAELAMMRKLPMMLVVDPRATAGVKKHQEAQTKLATALQRRGLVSVKPRDRDGVLRVADVALTALGQTCLAAVGGRS